MALKMTTAQVIETSVTNNSLSEDYSHQIKKSPLFYAHRCLVFALLL